MPLRFVAVLRVIAARTHGTWSSAATDRRNAATDRRNAATDRRYAATDRRNAATDRRNAATDRRSVATHRRSVATHRRGAATDRRNVARHGRNAARHGGNAASTEGHILLAVPARCSPQPARSRTAYAGRASSASRQISTRWLSLSAKVPTRNVISATPITQYRPA